MGFLAPAALAAALFAALPIAIHLLTSRAAERRNFPALAFLRRAYAGQARFHRIRDILILLLRILALLLMALALAGLFWTGNHGAAGRPFVVIVDASASMRQYDKGAQVWDHAIATAARLVEELHDRPATLVIAGTTIERSSLLPSLDRGHYRALLQAAQPGWGGSTNDQAIAVAMSMLSNGGDIHLISDGSRGTMSGIDPQATPSHIGLHVINAGGGNANHVIKSIALEPGVAVVGRACVVIAEIGNYDTHPATLTVAIGFGHDRRSHTVTIPPGESLSVSQTFTPQQTGTQQVSAAIITRQAQSSDCLLADDQRVGVVVVREALPVRIISDLNINNSADALKPVVAGLTAAGLVPTIVRSGQLRDIPVLTARNEDAVIVTVGLRSIAYAQALAGHMLGGGALVQIIHSDEDAALVKALDGIEAPLSVLPPVDLQDRQRGMTIGDVHTDHPLLFDLIGREPLLQQIEAIRYRPATLTPGAVSLIRWEDGSIAMAERRIGAGRWIAINMSPADDHTNMAALEVLPLMMSRIGQVLQPRRRDECAIPSGMSLPSEVAMVHEDGERVIVVDGACLLNKPGLYHSEVSNNQSVVAVAIPKDEGDVRHVAMPIGADGVAAQDAIIQARSVPMWSWALLIALVLLACESCIAGRLRKART